MNSITITAIVWAALMLLTYGYILVDMIRHDRSFKHKWNALKEALTEE